MRIEDPITWSNFSTNSGYTIPTKDQQSFTAVAVVFGGETVLLPYEYLLTRTQGRLRSGSSGYEYLRVHSRTT